MSRTMNIGIACAIVLLAASQAPAASIAFFNDGSYVDTAQEAANMRADLIGLGHTVTDFTGTSGAAWSAALAGVDVIVVPELELGDLSADLSASAKAALVAFVNGGGGFVDVFSNTVGFQSRAAALIQDISGISLTPVGSSLTGGSSTLNVANAAGTAFAGGVSPVSHPSGTGGVLTASTPAGTSIYESGTNTTVFATRSGSGYIVGLGNDWFSSSRAEWTSILGDAITYTSAVPEPATFALLGLGLVGIGLAARRRKRLE